MFAINSCVMERSFVASPLQAQPPPPRLLVDGMVPVAHRGYMLSAFNMMG
jgi:hypothetical protein